MDKFKLIVKHATLDEHMKLTVPHPVQQFHDQARYIIRQRAEMQNIPLLVYYTHRP